jgi:hypothetical protein
MENIKVVKTFQVTELTHSEIISYCKKNSLKVNDFVDKLLLKTIRSLNDREITQLFLQNDKPN